MLAKKTARNQITLPEGVPERIPDTDYFKVSLRAGEIGLKPVVIEGSDRRLAMARAKIAGF